MIDSCSNNQQVVLGLNFAAHNIFSSTVYSSAISQSVMSSAHTHIVISVLSSWLFVNHTTFSVYT